MIIKRIIDTEKARSLSNRAKYMLEVSTKANKPQIAEAVNQRFGVAAVKVNCLKRLSKVKKYKGRVVSPARVNTKIAIVTLKEGDKISPDQIV